MTEKTQEQPEVSDAERAAMQWHQEAYSMAQSLITFAAIQRTQPTKIAVMSAHMVRMSIEAIAKGGDLETARLLIEDMSNSLIQVAGELGFTDDADAEPTKQ